MDFSDPNSTSILTMTGSFDPAAPNGDGSFSVTMTGTRVFLENGEEISSEPGSASWLVVPNPEEDRWEVRAGARLLPELVYWNVEADPESDESINTLEYEFPALSLYPDCPRGMILVRRETIYGVSLETPLWIQIDSAQILFTTEGATSDAPEF